MLAEEVLRLCDRSLTEGKTESLLEATPAALDCAARLKRQRVSQGSCGSDATIQQLGQLAGSTPPVAAVPPSEPLPPAMPWAASSLLDFVHKCLANLTTMHATCAAIQRDTKAAHMACAVFRRAYLSRDPRAQAAIVRERLLSGSLLAASLWISIKFEANRTATPDANLMSRISGIPAGLLRQQELQILSDLGWDLMTPAREAGAVGEPDLTDAVAQDQLRQLAALAAPPPPAAPQLAAGLYLPAISASQLAALLAAQALPDGRAHGGSLPCSNLLAQPLPSAGSCQAAPACTRAGLVPCAPLGW